MKRIAEMLQRISPLRLLGRYGCLLFGVGVLSSLVLSVVEYFIAVVLVVFLCSLGFEVPNKLPSWWPVGSGAFSSFTIWFVLLFVGLIQAGAQITAYQSKILLTERIGARLKLILGYIILRQDRIHAMPLSRIDFYMAECFPKATSYVFYFTQLNSFCVQSIMITAGMMFLAWREALVGILGLGVMGTIVLQLNRFTNRAAKRVPEADASLERTKLRVVRNWILIRILRMQDAEYARLVDAVFRYYRHSVLAYFFGNFGGAFMPVLGIVIIAAMVMLHLHVFKSPATNFLAFLYLFVRLQQKLANGSNLIGGLFTFRVQFRESLRLLAVLSPADLKEALRPEKSFDVRKRFLMDPHELETVPRPVHVQRDRSAQPPSIHVRGVSFAWPDAEANVFENVSLEIKGGSQFGIVGPNGSGKSTMLGLILGIYPPSAGQVLIGDTPASAYFNEHPGQIAYVGPEPYLIHGSILENLTYGLADLPSSDEIARTLKTVRLTEMVESLPQGLQYVIHEDGSGLSSGQKQRLTIARAFLRHPLLLVLDEPSANLDETTESAVVDTLHELKGRCTVIMVSHKPGILRRVDQTLDMSTLRRGTEEGRV